MPVNRERKMVSKEVTSLYIEDDSLATILSTINTLIEQHGSDAVVTKETYSYSDQQYLAVSIKVPENDEQYSERIAREEKYEKVREDTELQEYKRLQAKFGESK